MILGILQARTSSTRLPGKVLKPILGVPMLLRQVERVRKSRLMDDLVVATSDDISDSEIEELCINNQISCFRGKINDVLDRFYQAAKLYNPDHVVRLTGDCPLIDPEIIDRIIAFHLDSDFDYTSNTLEPTFPDGLDAEVFRFSCLKEAWEKAKLTSQREHVTPYIYDSSNHFKLGSFKNKVDLSGFRWTVDEALDFELITCIYESLYPKNPNFNTDDILALLNERPELKNYNTRYGRNEGYQKSLLEDLNRK
jgi:spore coat polysaccharide biosynthesis protein SpsF